MRKVLLLILLLLPSASEAAALVEQSNPYEIDTWNTVVEPARYYGELTRFPHTFEFFISEPTVLRVSAGSRKKKDMVSVLLVKEQERGVREIARLTPETSTNSRDREWLLGLSFIKYEPVEVVLDDGLYRLEVSTPANDSRYMLQIGAEPARVGYFTALKEIFLAQTFFSSWLGAVRSPLIFVPLLIIFWFIRRKKK